jgi:hypothetical protein
MCLFFSTAFTIKNACLSFGRYFCDGTIKRALNALGFARVHNENEDCYGSRHWQNPGLWVAVWLDGSGWVWLGGSGSLVVWQCGWVAVGFELMTWGWLHRQP